MPEDFSRSMSEPPAVLPLQESSGIVFKIVFSWLMVRKFIVRYLYIFISFSEQDIFAFQRSITYNEIMTRKNLSTRIEGDLQKEIKKLAIDLEKPLNDLLEEAIEDLLKKYEKNTKTHK
jgi:hypothetical protein